MLKSSYQDLGAIRLPDWEGRRLRMHPVHREFIQVPDGFENFADVVSALCERADIPGEAFLTIDEKIVQPSTSHRNPGAHVDGAWIPEAVNWCGGGGGWCYAGIDSEDEHEHVSRMSAIVAASVPGCIVYPGEFEGEPRDKGIVEHLRDQFGEGELLPANRGFLLSPDTAHESKVFDQTTQRTFLRLVYHG